MSLLSWMYRIVAQLPEGINTLKHFNATFEKNKSWKENKDRTKRTKIQAKYERERDPTIVESI